MADFDWQATLAAVTAGAPEGTVAIAGQKADGVALGSYPLDSTGNYSLWVFSDPYKATITKEKGRDIEEVEEDVYETYNLACLLLGTKDDPSFKNQGVRVGGTKFTILRDLGKQTYQAKIEDGSSHPVTFDNIWVLKSRDSGLVLGLKGDYYFAAKYKSDPRSDPSLAIAERLSVGAYWACGEDQ